MKLPVFSFIAVAFAMTVFVSCKKGDVGPQGDPGTANVIYSEWFTPNAYKKDTVFGIWGFKYDKAAPAFTQQVLDSGTVITFAKLLGYNPLVWPANQVSQMPVSITYMQAGLQNDTWSALATPGNLRIRFVNDNNIYTSIATNHKFRYIVIPGGELTGRQAPLTYSEICKKYQIPE